MGARYLLDTNCPIDLFYDRFSPSGLDWVVNIINDFDHSISVITQIELLGYGGSKEETLVMEDFVKSAFVFPINEDVVKKTIDIKRKHKIKLPDAVIAATAITYNLILVTRNTKDFDKIENLKLVNPHEQ